VPGVAPAAKQMGAHVARVIRDRLAQRAARPFATATTATLPPSDAWRPWWTCMGCVSAACSPGGSGWWRTCFS
jgi:NADH dehydrogenase